MQRVTNESGLIYVDSFGFDYFDQLTRTNSFVASLSLIEQRGPVTETESGPLKVSQLYLRSQWTFGSFGFTPQNTNAWFVEGSYQSLRDDLQWQERKSVGIGILIHF